MWSICVKPSHADIRPLTPPSGQTEFCSWLHHTLTLLPVFCDRWGQNRLIFLRPFSKDVMRHGVFCALFLRKTVESVKSKSQVKVLRSLTVVFVGKWEILAVLVFDAWMEEFWRVVMTSHGASRPKSAAILTSSKLLTILQRLLDFA